MTPRHAPPSPGRRSFHPLLLLAVLFLLPGACGSAPTADMRKEAAARMQMGVSHLNQRNVPAAMKELAKASELDPDNAEIDMVLGLAFQARGDLDRAEKAFRTALRKRPEYPEAHNNYGYLLSQMGRSAEAIRQYEAAASDVLYPTPEVAMTNLGEEYRRLSDPVKAEAAFRKAIAFNPRYVGAYRALARLQSDRGNIAEATSTLEQCVGIAPEYWPGWLDLGDAQARLGKSEAALKAYRAVLAGTPDPSLRTRAAEGINRVSTRRK